MTPFIVDTNFFIQAFHAHYPMDVVPSFWSKVEDLANQNLIISVDKVQAELSQHENDLKDWCDNVLPADFFKDTFSVLSAYSQLARWATSPTVQYTTQAINQFLDINEADAWIVSYGLAQSLGVVTYEQSAPLSKKRIKIPDVCNVFNVPCLHPIEMFRRLRVTF